MGRIVITRSELVTSALVLAALLASATCPATVAAQAGSALRGRAAHSTRARPTTGQAAGDLDQSNREGGEFLIDTNSTCVPAPGGHASPAVAFDGRNYLAVWMVSGDGAPDNQKGDIFAARMTPQGTLLDRAGFAVSDQGADQTGDPVVAFGGSSFLVVWTDYRSGAGGIYAVRVTPQGTVLDTAAIPVEVAVTAGSHAVAFDGNDFLIVWSVPLISSEHLYAARVSPLGVLLDSVGTPICTPDVWQQNPKLAFDGTNSMVTWSDGSAIFAARIAPQGTILDTTGILVTLGDYSDYPDIAFDGTDYMLVWQDRTSTIKGARLTPQGAVLDSPGFRISRVGDWQTSPAIDFDGTDLLVAWTDQSMGTGHINVSRVTIQGVVLDSGVPVSTIDDYARLPALCSDGVGSAALWSGVRGASWDICGSRVDTQGVMLDSPPIVISCAADYQRNPAVAAAGSDFLSVWQDFRGDSGFDIVGARVTTGGAVLDPAGIAISTARQDQTVPDVGSDGADYLVAWQDERNDTGDIFATRITTQGAVLDPSGIPVCTAAGTQGSPAIASDGTNYLVAWEDSRNAPEGSIYAARLTLGGALLDSTPILVSVGAHDRHTPAVAFDGASYLVVWCDHRADYYDIYGARLTPQGVVLDTYGIMISHGASDRTTPTVTFDNTDFLVVWQDMRNGQDWDIYAARVSHQGTVRDTAGIAVCTKTGSQLAPTVCLDGTNSLVAWYDNNNSSNVLSGARVSRQGVVLDTLALVTPNGNQSFPALACASSGHVLLAYQGWTYTVAGKVYNSERIWGKLGPFTGLDEPVSQPRALPAVEQTVVRGVLYLRPSPVPLPLGEGQGVRARSVLLDITGCKALDLKPGPNDVSRLAPGVYFVRSEALRGAESTPSAVCRVPSAVYKVVLTK